VPASGAADPLSLALANRLVGNPLAAAGVETTFTGVSIRFENDCFTAVTGAKAKVWLNGERVKLHRTIAVVAGDHSGGRSPGFVIDVSACRLRWLRGQGAA
jgi:allophanate hydrolase subunit 2